MKSKRMKSSSNFMFAKQYYRAQEIMENGLRSQQQVSLVIESKTFPMLKFPDATPSSPLVLSTSHITASIIRQMKLLVAFALIAMTNPLEIIPAPTEKRQRFKNYLTADQAAPLSLLLAHAVGQVIRKVFDDSVFSNACQKMTQPGETLVFGSNYQDEKKQTHAIAVTLKKILGNQRQYYLIDSNGVESGSSQPLYSMGEVTDDPAEVQEFVKSALNLSKGMTVFIYSHPLNPLICNAIAICNLTALSPDDILQSILRPILSFLYELIVLHKLYRYSSSETRFSRADIQDSKPVSSPESTPAASNSEESISPLTLDSKESTTSIPSIPISRSSSADRRASSNTSYVSSPTSFLGSLLHRHYRYTNYTNQSQSTLDLR